MIRAGLKRLLTISMTRVNGLNKMAARRRRYSVAFLCAAVLWIGFAAAATINRFDFEVKWNELMEDGGLIAGKEVRIMLDLEADMVEE